MDFNKAKKLLIAHKDHLSKLGTRHLSVFGSTARNETHSSSELKCPVDLVSKRTIHPALKKRILNDAKEIF